MLGAINQYASVYSGIHSEDSTDPSGTSLARPDRKLTEKTQEVQNRLVRTEPGQKKTGPDGQPRDRVELSREAEEIRQLQVRDREVRAHEAAHAAVGGAYASSPSYDFERGPDGQTYAVGGEVSINVSPIAGDPEATIQKAQQVRAAALAPAEPSAQDMRVAQKAQAMAAKARAELAEHRSEELQNLSIPGHESAGQSSAAAGAEQGEQPAGRSVISSRISRLDIHA